TDISAATQNGFTHIRSRTALNSHHQNPNHLQNHHLGFNHSNLIQKRYHAQSPLMSRFIGNAGSFKTCSPQDLVDGGSANHHSGLNTSSGFDEVEVSSMASTNAPSELSSIYCCSTLSTGLAPVDHSTKLQSFQSRLRATTTISPARTPT